MIVVDTSVWVDVLNGTDTAKALRCVELIQDGAPVGVTDIIVTEVLQGLRTEREARLVQDRLLAFPILHHQPLDDYITAAGFYRQARKKGVTIRSTLDCLIAATCVRAGAALLHSDSDFDRLARCTPLTVFA